MELLPSHDLFAVASNPAVAKTGDAEWDSKLSAWLICDALARADYEFGRFADVNEKDQVIRSEFERKYGRNFYSIAEACDAYHPHFEAVQAAEEVRSETYLAPMWAAAAALALTPAPNLAAALFKLELIQRDELWNDGQVTRDAFEIVAEDMARFRAG